jgi:hypothetical protein
MYVHMYIHMYVHMYVHMYIRSVLALSMFVHLRCVYTTPTWARTYVHTYVRFQSVDRFVHLSCFPIFLVILHMNVLNVFRLLSEWVEQSFADPTI